MFVFSAPISFGQLPVKSVNERPNLVKSHDPLADPILRVLTLIYTLPQSLQWCVQYHVIVVRVKTTLGCTYFSVYLALISNQFLVIRNTPNGRRYMSSYPTNFLISNIFLIAILLRVGTHQPISPKWWEILKWNEMRINFLFVGLINPTFGLFLMKNLNK